MSNAAGRVAARSRQKGQRVLGLPLISIIDDDESMRVAIGRLVRSLGYAERGFASAEQFLERRLDESLVCIITDIQMPGMSGIELKKHLNALSCHLPVIMITARQEPGLEETALACGATCFLRKPFKAEALVGCLEKALKA